MCEKKTIEHVIKEIIIYLKNTHVYTKYHRVIIQQYNYVINSKFRIRKMTLDISIYLISKNIKIKNK